MAIRVSHADIGTYAQLGVLAGKATAAREAVERQAAMDRQVMQIQAQRASQERAQAHQKEMTEFSAYLDMERFKAAESFELEKMVARSRHDFDMQEARVEATFQNQLKKEQRADAEKEMKLDAIQKSDFLSDEEKRAARAKLEYDITLRQPAPLKPGEEMRTREADYDYYLGITEQYARNVKDADPRKWGKQPGTALLDKKGKPIRPATPAEENQLAHAERSLTELGEHFKPRADVSSTAGIDQRTGVRPTAPTTQSTAPATQPTAQGMVDFLQNSINQLPDKESQRQLENIIAEGNPAKIQKAYERVQKTVTPGTVPTKRRWFAFPGGPPPRG